MAVIPTFEELAARPDDALDVVLGAALIARDVHERLDVAALVDEVRALAGPYATYDLPRMPPRHRVVAVTDRFRSLGFHGNVDDYYDPKNSLLPDVLERKIGIPITLTLIWCEIARGCGIEAHGVGFPGHFLARVGPDPDPFIVDPFGGGRILDTESSLALLRRAIGDTAELHPSLFAPTSARAFLVRMLTNLKSVWAHRGDHGRAFVAVDRIVTLLPDSPRMLRERAGVALKIGIPDLAAADLRRVLDLEPTAPDAAQIRQRLAQLGVTARILN